MAFAIWLAEPVEKGLGVLTWYTPRLCRIRLGFLFKPLLALAILVPARLLVVLLQRRMKDGKLKRLLLRRIS